MLFSIACGLATSAVAVWQLVSGSSGCANPQSPWLGVMVALGLLVAGFGLYLQYRLVALWRLPTYVPPAGRVEAGGEERPKSRSAALWGLFAYDIVVYAFIWVVLFAAAWLVVGSVWAGGSGCSPDAFRYPTIPLAVFLAVGVPFALLMCLCEGCRAGADAAANAFAPQGGPAPAAAGGRHPFVAVPPGPPPMAVVLPIVPVVPVAAPGARPGHVPMAVGVQGGYPAYPPQAGYGAAPLGYGGAPPPVGGAYPAIGAGAGRRLDPVGLVADAAGDMLRRALK